VKKLLLFIAIIAVSPSAFAQVSFGPEVGMNLADVSVIHTSGSSTPITSSKGGILLGCIVDNPASATFSIQFGLYYATKGYNIDHGFTSINYFEIPLNGVYYFNVGADRIFIGAGPYVAYAVGGTTKDGTISKSLNIGTDTYSSDITPFDLGVNMMVGYKVAREFLVRMQFGLGLTNIYPNDAAGTEQNRVFSLSAAWLFGGKKTESKSDEKAK